MTWVLAYLSIGVLFNFIVDLLVDYFEKHDYDDVDKMRFDSFTKIIIGLLWPIAILIVLVSIFKKHTNES